MFALRAPLSTLGGVVFSTVLFLGLWQLVSVSMIAPAKSTIVGPDVRRVRPDTPAETRRERRVEREPVVQQPNLPRIGTVGDGPGVERVRYTPPSIDLGHGEGGSFRGVDGDVTPIVRQNPVYPPRELSKGIEGWVRVQFSVTSIGTVRDAVVVASEPEGVFNEAALKAIVRWRYNPRVENGESVERVGLQTVIRFEIEN